MSAILESKTAMRQLATKAAEIVKDDRMTPATKAAKLDEIEAQIEYHKSRIGLGEAAAGLMAGGDSAEFSQREGYLASPGRALKGLHAGIVSQGHQPIAAPQVELSDTEEKELYEAAVSHKSLSVTTKATDSTSITPASITDYRLPPVPFRREPTRVLSLIPTFATSAPSVTWYSTTGTSAAAAVAEGGTKPTSTIAYTANVGTVTKLAHVVEVTDETLADFAGFLGVLQQDMSDGLYKAENAELLTATVTGAHKFAGLLNTTGILVGTAVPGTPAQNDRLDAIGAAMDALRIGSSFTEPDGIIMHPTDWGTIKRNKDSQNRYLLSDPGTATDPRIWGVPVVLSTQMTQGTVLIGDFANSVAAYVRDGIRVETANQGTTQFTTNTTLVRAEERLLLTVPRPSGLIKVTGF